MLAVPLARLLGLGSIIGHLAAGIAIGPWGLRLVTDPQAMLEFAEFGVVLIGSAALITGLALALGVDWRLALVAGLGLAMSSTAIGLGVLGERELMATSAGQSVLSVALLQDIAAIPIRAILPLLAAQTAGGAAEAGSGWLGAN